MTSDCHGTPQLHQVYWSQFGADGADHYFSELSLLFPNPTFFAKIFNITCVVIWAFGGVFGLIWLDIDIGNGCLVQ